VARGLVGLVSTAPAPTLESIPAILVRASPALRHIPGFPGLCSAAPFVPAPFGTGQHYCLGFSFAEMQVKLVMHQLLQRYRWCLPAGYQVKFVQIPIQHPQDGLPVQLEALGD
jgi:hypothetical protein